MMRQFLKTVFSVFQLLVIGLVVSQSAVCACPQESGKQASTNPLRFIPEKSRHVFVVRPSDIVTSDDYQDLKRTAGKIIERIVRRYTDQYFKLGLAKLEDIESLAFADWNEKEDGSNYERPHQLVVLRTSKEHAAGFEMATHGVTEELEFKGQKFLKLKRSPYEKKFAWIANDKTIVWGNTKHSIESAIAGGEKGIQAAKWYKTWKPMADKSISFVFHDIAKELSRAPEALSAFKQIQTVVGNCDPEFKFKVQLLGVCKSAKDAARVKEAVPMALQMAKGPMELRSKHAQAAERITFEKMVQLLDAAKVKTDSNIVHVNSSIAIDLHSLSQPIEEIYEASKRTHAANNLRQSALAMHNFHSAMNGFPTSVLVHPKTGKEYSWRIAILPYIEQNEIYEQYDFSQDWDSPHNLAVTSNMPDVFRADWDDEDSTNTSFFLLTGPDSPLGGEKAMGFGEITDGSSNTIMAVEAKRDIHWAKPEDIMVDPEQPFPELGGYHRGGFNVTMMDGSVRFVSENVLPELLMKMFTPAGGEVFTEEEWNPPNPEESPDSAAEAGK